MNIFIYNEDTGYILYSVIHGFTKLGHNVTLSHSIHECLYKDQQGKIDESTIKKFYGHAFTIDRTFIHNEFNVDIIKDHIINHHYDLCIFNICNNSIIYNEIFNDLLSLATTYYTLNNVFIIDESDDASILYLKVPYNKYIYFKRELRVGNILQSNVQVFPICYSIPREKFYNKQYYKPNLYINNYGYEGMMYDPPKRPELNYNTINGYFKAYNDSGFAITGQKGGYDRMVHYEIIASHCLPVFVDYLKVPRGVMMTWPTEYQLAANSLWHKYLFNLTFDESKYFKLLDEFYEYAYVNLNTEKIIEYILKFC